MTLWKIKQNGEGNGRIIFFPFLSFFLSPPFKRDIFKLSKSSEMALSACGRGISEGAQP